MAVLPITAALLLESGKTLTITLTDSNGVQFAAMTNDTEAGAPPMDTLVYVRQWIRDQIAKHLTWADLPTTFTVTIGLDATMRELDLL